LAIFKFQKIILVEIPGNYFNFKDEIKDLKWYSYRREYKYEWQNYFKISILQNPYRRFISNYLYLRNQEKNNLKSFQKIDKKKIRGKSAREVSYIINEMESQIWDQQASYVARKNNLKIDKIFMIEDLIKGNSEFPLDYNFKFYDFNYRSYYNSEMRSYIENQYSDDIKLLNSSF